MKKTPMLTKVINLSPGNIYIGFLSSLERHLGEIHLDVGTGKNPFYLYPNFLVRQHLAQKQIYAYDPKHKPLLLDPQTLIPCLTKYTHDFEAVYSAISKTLFYYRLFEQVKKQQYSSLSFVNTLHHFPGISQLAKNHYDHTSEQKALLLSQAMQPFIELLEPDSPIFILDYSLQVSCPEFLKSLHPTEQEEIRTNFHNSAAAFYEYHSVLKKEDFIQALEILQITIIKSYNNDRYFWIQARKKQNK